MRKLFHLTVIALVVIMTSCNGNGDGVNYLEKAWESFEKGDLADARSNFEKAISETSGNAEAFTGLGWCAILEDNLAGALTQFETALGYENLLDANAGAAIVAVELEDFSEAIEFADNVLRAVPDYIFSHYTSVTARILRLTKAKSAAALGDFQTALDEIQEIDASFDADPKTAEGQDQILAKIEELIAES
ncbi:tetratricopeptide repeat protein [candidate division WOR-3 bacterium]|nr:tetratricopeptide repeat protein [candidate division WOR-3 bacterium]